MRIPAIERALENVCTIIRLSYFFLTIMTCCHILGLYHLNLERECHNMILFWLTVAGILFIILGKSTDASALAPFGIYLLLPLVIFIIVKVLKKIYNKKWRS